MKFLTKLLIKFYYSPKHFWEGWADDFIRDEWQVKTHSQHDWLLKKIKKSKANSILEVGCGFGRNIKFLSDNGVKSATIQGFDISPSMIRLAKRRVDKKTRLFVADILNLKFSKKSDLVFTHGVLMHVKPNSLVKALDNITALTNKYIILIEQNYGGNKYTFNHKYKKYLNNTGVKILEYKNDKKLGLDLIYAEVRKD